MSVFIISYFYYYQYYFEFNWVLMNWVMNDTIIESNTVIEIRIALKYANNS
jgi:hypothetical protein